ncbi:FAD-binding domain-containing protein, partial [Pleomassaria siparia CBS 279.74]
MFTKVLPRSVVLISAIAICLSAMEVSPQYSNPNSTSCRYLPGDKAWPSTREWQHLNSTVSGRLIATVPLGSVCHDPTYDAEACESLYQTWSLPQTHFGHPSSFMSAYHQNASCNPYTPESSPCLLGNTVSYTINVTSAKDVKAGLDFAQRKNVRLVIKNTGHDYLGKSTGEGALGLWTHNLKTIDFLNFTSPAYSGPAIKIGAGVQAFEAYEAAAARGLKIVGGECITVGLAGGYTQGGGHSLLSSKYGMGADQALEWELVTANGTHLTASPSQNSDLYWALSGGGGGTYAVVLSLTAKAYPDGLIGGASMAVPFSSTDDDALWDLVSFFQATALPPIVDAGGFVQWGVFDGGFLITEVTIPDATESDMRSVMGPFTAYLNEQSISFQLNVTALPNYLQHLELYQGPFPYGSIPVAQNMGGVMISRETVQKNNTALTAVLRTIVTTQNFYIAPFSFNVGRAPSSPNAVLPAWRDALTYYNAISTFNFTVPFSVMNTQKNLITDVLMPPLQQFASGAYMNEADDHDPKWREEFYGDNFGKLKGIKSTWDPEDLFYATTAVGSDAWSVAEDGRLCRA